MKLKLYFKRWFRNLDYSLVFTYILLVLFGLVMIYSASQMTAISSKGQSPDFFYNSQLTHAILAFVAFLVTALITHRLWSTKGFLIIFVVAAIGLGFYLKLKGFGADDVGSKSWVRLMGRSFQPSEAFKLILILYFSGVFYRKSMRKKSIQNLTVEDIKFPVIIWLAMLLSTVTETDLGAVGILFVIAFGLLFASGVGGKVLAKFTLGIFTLGSALIGILLVLKWDSIFTESRLGRFKSFSNPFEFAEGSGMQIINGYYAIGNGGLEGVGLGQSIQKLGYLPHPHTDFILAIIAEELGILGVLIVLGGIGFIVLKAFYIAFQASDVRIRMLSAGIGTWLGTQTVLNVGGMSGVLPLTGVTLPFISYGGTSLILLSLAMGILVNVSTLSKIEKRNR